jgi:CHASE3 domain sensor protein
MNSSLKISLGLTLACLLIFSVMIHSSSSTSRLISSTELMVRKMEVINQMERLSTLFVTAQNNLRAYLMSHQEFYRGKYAEARAELGVGLKRAEELVKGNDLQSQQIQTLKSMLEQKFAKWDEAPKILEKGGLPELIRRLRAPEVKNQDLSVFEAMAAIQREENRVFDEKLERARSMGKKALAVTLAGNFLAFVLIVAAALVVSRDNRRRRRAESEIDRFFNLSLDLLCISGMDGFFKRLSPSYAETLGYPLKELYARPIVDFIHPADVAKTVTRNRAAKIRFQSDELRKPLPSCGWQLPDFLVEIRTGGGPYVRGGAGT